jgi:hypothetical protein
VRVDFVHDVGYTCRDIAPDLNEIGVETGFIRLTSFYRLARTIRRSKADIIHANYIRTPAYASYLSLKRPYILHAHGDDIRYGLTFLQKLCIRSAASTFYATDDLKGIIKNSIHIPQPVDTKRFFPQKTEKSAGALYFELVTSDDRLRWHEKEYIEQMRKLCEEKGIKLTLTPKVINGIPYEKMPEYVSGFRYFFDREYPLSHSKTALECMAMKISVISFDMQKNSGCFEAADALVEERYAKVVRENSTKSVANLVKSKYEEALRLAQH